MPARSARQVVDLYIEILNSGELDRLAEVVTPACIMDYPQSGERIRGLANIQSVFAHYPGGSLNERNAAAARIIGDEPRWLMTPNFTIVRADGMAGGPYTSTLLARYPGHSDWYVISTFELDDGFISSATLFFAPVTEAPDWRRPFAEPIPD